MRTQVTITGSFTKALDEVTDETAKALTRATERTARQIRDDLRGAIQAAGLGNLGRALDYAGYPGNQRFSLRPAADVFVRGKEPSAKKWDGIIHAFANGATIKSRNGWLAIPTKNCPKGRRGRYLSPNEVAERFGPLQTVAKGKSILLFADVVAGKSSGYRRNTSIRASQGRIGKLVLMFVLVKDATVTKRLDIDSVVRRWETRFQGVIENAVKGL